MASRERLNFGGARLDDADFSAVRLHSPNFEGATITDGWLRNADISGAIDGLRVNGVEIAPLVEAELDRRFPQRVMLRAEDPQGLAQTWAMIEDVWRTTVERARTLPGQPYASRRSAAATNGAASACSEPIWQPMPVISMLRMPAARRYGNHLRPQGKTAVTRLLLQAPFDSMSDPRSRSTRSIQGSPAPMRR